MKTLVMLALCVVCLTGCLPEDKRQELKEKAHSAIIEYVQNEGREKAIAYIDKLVEEGKLGSKNAEKIKDAIPKGIDQLKKVMGEIEAEQ